MVILVGQLFTVAQLQVGVPSNTAHIVPILPTPCEMGTRCDPTYPWQRFNDLDGLIVTSTSTATA